MTCCPGEVLLRITGPSFVAGIVVRDRRIVEAAPVLRYMIGWDGRRFARYVIARRWRFEVVDTRKRPPPHGER